MDPKIAKALETANNWYKIPVNSQLAVFFEGNGPIPSLNVSLGDTAARFFIEELLESHTDKIFQLIFDKPTKNYKYEDVLTDFFQSCQNHPDLVAQAYEIAVPNILSEKKFYKELFEYSNQDKLLKNNQTKYAQILLKDEQKFTSFFTNLLASSNASFYFRKYADLLIKQNPQFLVSHFKEVIYETRWSDWLEFQSSLAIKVIEVNAEIFEDIVRDEVASPATDYLTQQSKFKTAYYLFQKDKKKYKDFYLAYIQEYLNFYTIKEKAPEEGFRLRDIAFYDKDFKTSWSNTNTKSLIYILLQQMKEISVSEFETAISNFCAHSAFMPMDIIPLINEHYKEEALPLLKDILKIKNHDYDLDYPTVLLENIVNKDWAPYAKEVWNFSTRFKFFVQAKIVKHLVQKPKIILPFAEVGITKTKQERLLSFLIFANIDSKHSELWSYFHQEKDDGIREQILPIVKRIFYKGDFSLKQVNEIIQLAIERDAFKKGLKGNILDLNQLPDIYLTNGKKLTKEQVNFLIYRMSMIKVMQSDTEAKLLINQIDKNKSTDFAKAILEAFLEKGAPAKQKYIMCLAGILGDESLLNFLQKLFRQLHDNKRLKMAQYVISTIAMIGTDKALRHVEYISRKYKRKASLEAAAIEALENAAEELGIDMYELSDRIIPDFGFDGLYKTIEVDGDELRVFVGKDFKLQFITDEGKTRKSVPKAASKELKTELKTIQKEIREVNRAQKERLEQYMVLERRWALEDWRKFYLMNPVMFIYASTLVWGIFNDKNELQQLFYVNEDADILDLEDDEVDISKGKLGIIHPLRLSEKDKKAWSQKFFEYDITQPFDQLNRQSFGLNEKEKEGKTIDRYEDMKPSKGQMATQTHFEKRGWRKDVSDGGCFQYAKTFKQEGLYAFLNLEGMCIGWYDEEIIFHKIHFMKIGKYAWREENFLPLKVVPAIMFSEVIADMEGIAVDRKEEK